jgi:dsRNA-specific ribonuclease
LDQGFDAVFEVVKNIIFLLITRQNRKKDPKSRLQEIDTTTSQITPDYNVIDEE